MSETIRIAMWSGPRNISTAMMRAFENRPDTEVIDEPFYAAYLAASGADHPMREVVLAKQESDPAKVAQGIVGSGPLGAPIFYQKHMTHHMLPGFERGWMERCRHAFLIRAPERVLASYAARRADVEMDDIGFVQQASLFDEATQRMGRAPPVIDADDVLADPRRVLGALCAALDIPFHAAMLNWPAGPRPTDGAWAPAWYDAVLRSTGFAASPRDAPVLDTRLGAMASAVRPIYERLARDRL
ncbi:MAG TPA: hypothetical protein VIJ59_05765 [Caulobacteraceae bacterium]